MMIPTYATFETWGSSLVIDFPDDDIPLAPEEEKWKEWGNELSQCTSFIENNAPGTEYYKEWKEWAQAVFFCMNNF